MKRKDTHKPAPVVAASQPEATQPAVVVFGMTAQGLPQAAWFPEAEAELAVKAAGLMQLRAAKVETDQHRELAKQLRQGQVYASERTFAPVVNETLYRGLFELCGEAPVEDLTLPRPSTFAEIQVGSLVLAHEEDPEDGWYEAVVVAVKEDLMQLRWRWAAREASFIRPRDQIAILAPEKAVEAGEAIAA